MVGIISVVIHHQVWVPVWDLTGAEHRLVISRLVINRLVIQTGYKAVLFVSQIRSTISQLGVSRRNTTDVFSLIIEI